MCGRKDLSKDLKYKMQKKDAWVGLCGLKSLHLTKEGIIILGVHILNRKSFRTMQNFAHQSNICNVITYFKGDALSVEGKIFLNTFLNIYKFIKLFQY